MIGSLLLRQLELRQRAVKFQQWLAFTDLGADIDRQISNQTGSAAG